MNTALISAPALTPRRERFAQLCAAGSHATEAYRAAFRAKHMAPPTVRTRAYELKNQPDVAARVRELLAQSAEVALISARARMVRLQDIVEADPGELVRVVAECCRWCHGAGHAYQWTDVSEFAQALKVAVVANKVRRTRARAEQALPIDAGGYGFRADAEPHADCPHCHGEGAQRVVVTPTSQLSSAARKLLKSVRQKSSGEIEVRLHDQLQAIDLLNKMQGIYVDRSIAVNVNANVPALDKMSRDEQLAFLESLKPTT